MSSMLFIKLCYSNQLPPIDSLINEIKKTARKDSKKIESDIFIKWMLSEEGTKAISSFQVEGHQLFFPNRN